MTRLIYSLRLNRSRHVLRAGQRARQMAGLLGYESQEQSAISAAAFAVAYKAVVEHKTARLQFLLSDHRFLIRCRACADGKVERETLALRPCSPSGQSSPPLMADLNSANFGDWILKQGLITLSWPLPDKAPRLDAADLPWIIREVGRITPLDPLEEFYQLNRELLRLLRLTRVDLTFHNRGEHAA